MLRIHYIHSGWFQDFNKRFLENRLKNLSLKQDPLKTVNQILSLAQKNNLTVCFDLFSLVPESMGSCEGWKNDASRYIDPKRIEIQNQFLIQFLDRTKNNNNLTIDLVNEPEISYAHTTEFIHWVNEKVKIIKSLRPQILVTVGFTYPGLPIHALDYYSIHSSQIHSLPYQDKPVLFQEFWAHSKGPLFSEEKAWKNFILGYYKAQKLGYSGFMPWAFKTPGTLYETEGESESWESHLGLFLRSDGSKKHTLPWIP